MPITADVSKSVLECGLTPWKCIKDGVGDAVGGVAGNAAGNVLESIAESIAQAVGSVITSVGTMWVKVDTPNLTGGAQNPDAPAAAGSGSVAGLMGYLMWIGLAVCIGSLLVAGARMAWPSHHSEDLTETGRRLSSILLGAVLVGAASAVVGALFSGQGPRVRGAAGFIQNSTWSYVLILAMASVVIAGIRLAWDQRAHPARDLVRSLLTLVLVTAAALPVLGVFITAMDDFSVWILNRSLDCDLTAKTCFTEQLGTLVLVQGPQSGPFLMIVLGFIALLTSLFQLMLMAARAGMLVVLAGVLPLSASATNTEWGSTWFKRTVGWLVAFILYKPAAAVIYAAAFRLPSSGDDGGLMAVLTTIMLMILAVVALPALMRLIVPAVGSMAAAGGGGMALAAAAVPAMGAVSALGRSGAEQGGSSPAGGSGPTGSGGSDGDPGPAGADPSPPAGDTAVEGAGSSGAHVPASSGAASSGAATGGAAAGGAAAGAAATGGATVAVEAARAGVEAAKGAVESSADQANDPQGA